MTVPMLDTVAPGQLPPAYRGPVAAYVNGPPAWTRAEEARHARIIRISVEPGQPEAARYARALDVERFDAAPDDVPAFISARLDAGHHDATIYSSASVVKDVLAEIGKTGLTQSPWRLWVAWWWGRPRRPTQQEVWDEVHALGAPGDLDVNRVWACQWQNGATYDTSAVYGLTDFSRG